MREFARVAGALFRRDRLVAMTQTVGLLSRFLNSIVAISSFYFVAHLVDGARFARLDRHMSNYFSYVTINMAFTALQATALLSAARAVRDDQVQGALEPILATQRNGLLYVIAAGAWPLTLGLFEVVISLTTATILGLNLRETNLPSLATFLLLGVVVMTATGALSAAMVIAFKRLPPASYLIGGAAALLAGALFPVTLLPLPLRVVSWCLPLTHALSGFRGAAAGESLAVLWPDALWLTVVSVILMPVAASALAAATDRGRRDGTLSQY